MNNYEPVIGLEVHVELNTKSKMFCKCSADYFGKLPNTHTCPVCLGLPGALPFINQQAIEDCMKVGLALNCSVSENSRFERKNYFYPDLPKGYQVSQYRWPLCVNGWIEIAGQDRKTNKIRINRVHQEEDTGKLTHADGQTLIDFNRSGVPLVEIVTEPDFHFSEEVREFAKKMQQLFRHLGVSNADMEKGDMRLEANVSIRPEGFEGLPNYRIELKNINSFRFMVAAIEYEIKRQAEALDKGEVLHQETRGWDEDKKQTYLQRSKEEAHDYRYFPEPDLPELRVKYLEARVKEEIPELPEIINNRLINELGVSESAARIIAEDKKLADFFEKVCQIGKEKNLSPSELANLIVNQKVDISEVSPTQIVETLMGKRSGIVEDDAEITKLSQEVLLENPKLVDAYKAGKVTVLQALIGAVMRKSSGKANASKVKDLLEKLLN